MLLTRLLHKWKACFRVTTCLENLEMSGISTAVREMSGILLKVWQVSGTKYCQGKVAKNCLLLVAYFRVPTHP